MNYQEEMKNAIIESARIEIEDHGILTVWLTLDYGGSGQGFGGYSLYLPPSFKHHSRTGIAGFFIYRVLEIAGVERWQDLKGKTIRVKATYDGIHAIGHIVKDDWFIPSEDMKEKNGTLPRMGWRA